MKKGKSKRSHESKHKRQKSMHKYMSLPEILNTKKQKIKMQDMKQLNQNKLKVGSKGGKRYWFTICYRIEFEKTLTKIYGHDK